MGGSLCLSSVGWVKDRHLGRGKEEWGIATSGRQVSGTVQAPVTFPAKGEEGGEGRRGLPRVLWGEGKSLQRPRGPESDGDQWREIIRPCSPVSALVSAGEGFAHSCERKLLAKGLDRTGHQSCIPRGKQRRQEKFKPGRLGKQIQRISSLRTG